MTVAELIAKLQEMPQDKEVIMFDGPSQYTPYKVEVADWGGKNIKGKVIIDWYGILHLRKRCGEEKWDIRLPA